jgi:hypothetical protein
MNLKAFLEIEAFELGCKPMQYHTFVRLVKDEK